jgi:hypothetical protein
MLGSPWIPVFAACAWMGSCSEPKLECGANAVTGTLSSLVRDRVLRVAADAYPATMNPARRGALIRATRVTPREARLLEWNTSTGRLACIARVVVDAPGPDPDTNLRRETVLRYRVTRDDDVFLVEVAYADLMAAFPSQPAPAPGTGPKP